MAGKHGKPFDSKIFLGAVGEGRTIKKYRKDAVIFHQGDPAESVFYVLRGKIKLTIVSPRGKDAVVAILNEGFFFGEGCLAGQPLRERVVRHAVCVQRITARRARDHAAIEHHVVTGFVHRRIRGGYRQPYTPSFIEEQGIIFEIAALQAGDVHDAVRTQLLFGFAVDDIADRHRAAARRLRPYDVGRLRARARPG